MVMTFTNNHYLVPFATILEEQRLEYAILVNSSQQATRPYVVSFLQQF